MATQAGPDLAVGSTPISAAVPIWIQGNRHVIPGALRKSYYDYINSKMFFVVSGLMQLLFICFSSIVIFLPSVRETWPLLRDANAMCFAISSVLWLSKQTGTTHLVTRPRRCQERTPGWKHSLAGDVFASCVYTRDSWGLCCWKRT